MYRQHVPQDLDTLANRPRPRADRAIRLLMLRVVDERRLPFEVKAPNATPRKAIAELEAGKGKRFTSTDALMADLNADD
jgi:DNA-damage-inducible protein J